MRIPEPTPNTQAMLLLTAPLLTGRAAAEINPLTPGEYKRLSVRLREMQCEPADLLAPGVEDRFRDCGDVIDTDRLQRLMERGFQLSQAIEDWQARAIWVLGHRDDGYPRRLLTRLEANAPALLYGCGDPRLLETGGLAVVGSRHVDEALVEYTIAVGQLAALSGRTIVSGGAKGIDQAAMRGAMEAEGRVTGVLPDGLERAALNRDNRDLLVEGRLVLVSPYDPRAGFNVGNAMQRNKLIYALADAALVVSSDLRKGGTWAGAIEQLEKLRLVPVYVRATGEPTPGLEALLVKGARPWPDPADPDAFESVFDARPPRDPDEAPSQMTLF